jgi:hypothetical protein
MPDKILDGVAEVALKMLTKGLEIGTGDETGGTGNALSDPAPWGIAHAPLRPGPAGLGLLDLAWRLDLLLPQTVSLIF